MEVVRPLLSEGGSAAFKGNASIIKLKQNIINTYLRDLLHASQSVLSLNVIVKKTHKEARRGLKKHQTDFMNMNTCYKVHGSLLLLWFLAYKTEINLMSTGKKKQKNKQKRFGPVPENVDLFIYF